MNLDQAVQTQLANVRAKTGRSLEELLDVLKASGLEKHGQLVTYLKSELGMGHGDANLIVTLFRNPPADSPEVAGDPVVNALDGIYGGTKAALRPLHERAMSMIEDLGAFEIAPKKTYLSLRRKKQFAMVGPGSRGRLEVGLNMRDVAPGGRLEQLPPGGMCQYRVYLTGTDEVDDELLGWLRTAYQSAG